MKRSPALKALSIDHHHGLVLAHKAKKAAAQELSGNELQAIWMELQEHADAVLAAHFEIEESYIAAAFAAFGDPHLIQLADRLTAEHAALRQLLSPDTPRNAANLKQLGELLQQHIRFEERELFEAAQTALDEDTLQAIATACDARHN
ncbi:Hemerythrin HHE cation binding domain-containing protein [Nitrosomonas sp. Nm51]|uniref:hemerythrin domain-containing protein n=1 Tax=Nitrosomonas sp. Nm51 TaxID=133720 RepID=UPI0008C85D3C|nr:hemerythrin domain-containing protein [Nitrosomonas sp. Nm51]SER38097.1 Hemerythrin HHE cation binding domain-containing protein [Nitrosomonas sp. Nm51]